MIKFNTTLIVLFTLSSCSNSSQVKFADYYKKDRACGYIKVDNIKSILSIKQDIRKEAKFSDSFFNGFIGSKCELSWEDNNDESQTITFNLTQLKSQDIFPPRKLSEKQLVAKINQANKAMKSYTSSYDKSMIENMKKNNNNSIRHANNYQIINDLGDSATITRIVANNDVFSQNIAEDSSEKQGNINIYTLAVKSGNFILKINSSTKDVSIDLQEALIQITTQILQRD